MCGGSPPWQAQDDPNPLTKQRLQFALVVKLRRIHGVPEDMPPSVPQHSVLAAEPPSSPALAGLTGRGEGFRRPRDPTSSDGLQGGPSTPGVAVAIGRPLREPCRCE